MMLSHHDNYNFTEFLCFNSCRKQKKITGKYEMQEFAVSVKPKENDEDSLEITITNEGRKDHYELKYS